jgi:hypothetical protein
MSVNSNPNVSQQHIKKNILAQNFSHFSPMSLTVMNLREFS